MTQDANIPDISGVLLQFFEIHSIIKSWSPISPVLVTKSMFIMGIRMLYKKETSSNQVDPTIPKVDKMKMSFGS